MAYLPVHEGDPSFEHCTVTSVPFDLKLEGKTFSATVTVQMDGTLKWMVHWNGWYFEMDGTLKWMVHWNG